MFKGKRKFVASVEKIFGKGLATFADDEDGKISRLPFRIAQLDYLTGGGLPLGKISMFRGPESGTKTSLAIIICARFLESNPDKLAIYLDAEEKYPAQFVRRLGIDLGRFVTASPETAENSIDFIEFALRDKSTGILVVDSIAALVPKIEIDASAEDQQQGVAPRMVNKMVRKIIGALKAAKNNGKFVPTVVLINQERIKIGVRYGDPTTIPGGEGQKYAASLSLRLRTVASTKDEDEQVPKEAPAVKVAARVIKHSFGPKDLTADFYIAMEKFANLKAGDSRDEIFIRRMCSKLNLISKVDGKYIVGSEKFADIDALDEGLRKRGKPYEALKAGLRAYFTK